MKGSNKILNGNFILGILNIQGNTAINASGQVNILDKLELQSAQLNTNNKLTLKSSAAKTAFVDDFSSGFNGTVTGNLSIERYVPGSGNKFHYFGALTGGTASKWNDDYTITSNATDSTAVTLDPSKPCGPTALAAGSAYGNLLTYDEKLVTNCFLKGWRVRNTNAATSRGRGFAGRVPSTTVLTEAGTYDKTNVTLSGLSVTGTNTDATSKGFHFVSNPFWAPILWSGVTGSNLYGTAYRYDPNTGSYGAYNNITAPMEISTNEAFFVRGNWATVNAGNSTFSITFPASARTTGENNTFLRSGLPYAYGVKITVNAHNTTDYTLIAFDNRFTTAHDNGYDALKLDNDFNVANIYTIDATAQRSAILALPENTATASVPLNIDIRYTDLHNLTFDLQSFPSTAMVFLEDKTTGVWHNLRVNNTYSFNATIGDNSDRFVLHFTPAAVFNATASGCENNTGIISIQQDGGITWDYEIKDQQNTTVLSGSNLTGYIEFTQLAAGNYTIALVHESGYTATENITVIATENISLTVNATANTIFVNEPVTVNAILSSNGTTNWDMGDGTVYNNTETVIHSYTVAGNYLVSATAANDNCNDTKTIDITVEENLVTGIAANNDKTLKVYASGNTVFVEQYASKELVNADLTLYNTLGQIIQQDKISELNYGAKQQINVNASNGIYYLHVVLSNGKEVQTKLLINR
jgi:PKD repeat protein